MRCDELILRASLRRRGRWFRDIAGGHPAELTRDARGHLLVILRGERAHGLIDGCGLRAVGWTARAREAGSDDLLLRTARRARRERYAHWTASLDAVVALGVVLSHVGRNDGMLHTTCYGRAKRLAEPGHAWGLPLALAIARLDECARHEQMLGLSHRSSER